MKIFTWNDILSYLNTGIVDSFFEKGTGISIGSFDGMHLGHRAIINELVSNCNKNNLIPGVISFSRPLPSIKHSNDYQGDVSTLEQRLNIFEQLGVKFAVIIDFTDEFASILGADFLNILVNACNMEFICEGVDFRFGYKGATDVQAIKYFAEKNKIATSFVDQVIYSEGDEEERISSSYIRSMVTKGFMATVQTLLARSYSISISIDKVEKNKLFSIEKSFIKQVIPPKGVYHCKNENHQMVRLEITDTTLKYDEESKELSF